MSRMSQLNEADKLLGARVRKQREIAGMTMQALADTIGKTQPYISRLEAGKYKLKLTMAAKIAKALGVTLDELAEPIMELT